MKLNRSTGGFLICRNKGRFNVFYSKNGVGEEREIGIKIVSDNVVHYGFEIAFWNFSFGFWFERKRVEE